eukprot:scaffold1633_cov147-Skeletonema_menzelii.AAC.15
MVKVVDQAEAEPTMAAEIATAIFIFMVVEDNKCKLSKKEQSKDIMTGPPKSLLRRMEHHTSPLSLNDAINVDGI